MHAFLSRTALRGAALSTLVLAAAMTGCDSSDPDPVITQPAYVLNDDETLFEFDLVDPRQVREVGDVTGLAQGEQIVGMDVRPATGTPYLLGRSGRLYTLNVATGAATPGATLSISGTALALAGTAFGVDFNPVPDRLRVVSDTGQNLRINVDTGETIVDGTLTYASGDAAGAATPQVLAAGYTNSRSGTVTETQLFVIDAGRNTLVLQNPPNAGTLNTVGALGLDVSATTAFDIRATGNDAFAVVQNGGRSDLVRVHIATGSVTRVGELDVPGTVRGMSVPTAP